MLFRVGGITAVEEFMAYERFRLEVASALKCLGITIQATGHSLLQNRLQPFGSCRIKKPNALPLNAAMKLSSAKIVLILAYGLKLVWVISVRC